MRLRGAVQALCIVTDGRAGITAVAARNRPSMSMPPDYPFRVSFGSAGDEQDPSAQTHWDVLDTGIRTPPPTAPAAAATTAAVAAASAVAELHPGASEACVSTAPPPEGTSENNVPRTDMLSQGSYDPYSLAMSRRDIDSQAGVPPPSSSLSNLYAPSPPPLHAASELADLPPSVLGDPGVTLLTQNLTHAAALSTLLSTDGLSQLVEKANAAHKASQESAEYDGIPASPEWKTLGARYSEDLEPLSIPSIQDQPSALGSKHQSSPQVTLSESPDIRPRAMSVHARPELRPDSHVRNASMMTTSRLGKRDRGADHPRTSTRGRSTARNGGSSTAGTQKDDKDRPWACQLCPSRFSIKGHLSQHNRYVHEKYRPHACPSCPASFGTRFARSQHIWTVHEGRKPFVCEVPGCTASFGQRSHLNRHAKRHKTENGDAAP